METQHGATLAKLFCDICVIQGVLYFSFALMKFFLCFRDKVLLFETSGLGLWVMDCRDPSATKGVELSLAEEELVMV